MPPSISAVVPTYNRTPYLRKALQSLAKQTLEAGAYEILVVDNASTDDTKRLVLEEFGDVPNLRYIYEPVLGLNVARNTGWQNSRGEFVAYTDDDAIPASDWLERMLEAWFAAPEKVGCLGGPVEPIWEAPRPDWLSQKFDLSITILELSSHQRELEDYEWLVGANIGFRRQLLSQIGGFRAGLDRTGSKLLSGGEIQLQAEFETNGVKRVYCPQVRVRHHLSPTRLTKPWFVRRWYWQGVSEAIMQIWLGPLSVKERLYLGAYKLRQFMLVPDNWIALVVPSKDSDSFYRKCSAAGRLGFIMGLWGISK